MWLMTTIGFFSVVQKPGETALTVRSRVRADLERLRERYLPSLSTISHKLGTDYPYRACVSHDDFAVGIGQMVRDIQYANFKSEVEKTQGHARESIYTQVWGVLRKLEGLADS